MFSVSVETRGLVGHASGPFFVDFQLVDGEGVGNGDVEVSLSGFDFGGGSWPGTHPGPIVLRDDRFFSDFVHEFEPGTSLTFDVTMTAGGNASRIPDRFSFAILDGGFAEIPTVGEGDALFAVDVSNRGTVFSSWSSDRARTAIGVDPPLILVPEVRSGWVAFVLAFVWVAHRSPRAHAGDDPDFR